MFQRVKELNKCEQKVLESDKIQQDFLVEHFRELQDLIAFMSRKLEFENLIAFVSY